jgi:hypothetical protein
MELYKFFLEVKKNDNSQTLFATRDLNYDWLSISRSDDKILIQIDNSTQESSFENDLLAFFDKFHLIKGFIRTEKNTTTLIVKVLFDDEMHQFNFPSKYLEMINKNNLLLRISCDFLE